MQTQCFMPTAATKVPSSNRICPPAPARHDEELLATYAETGSRQAFEELVHLYERELYGYLRHFLGDAQLAEDVFQSTFLQVHLKCRQFERGRRFRPWLYKIASNQAVDLLRRRRRHKLVSLSAVAMDAGSDEERQPLADLLAIEDSNRSNSLEMLEDCQRTRSALDKLPTRLRQLLILVVYQGLQYREAAEVLGIPLGTVKSRMHKALQSLHEALLVIRYSGLPENRDNALLAKA